MIQSCTVDSQTTNLYYVYLPSYGVVGTESKSQTPTEGHPIAHIVCLLAKSLSQQNSDLNETQSNN